MVQVDIFWSYGLNAGLALAAGSSIRSKEHFWESKFFTLSLLWTACIFAPSGMYLLWNFPGWETMFVAQNHSSIPAWLVTLFCLTNITQGVLGFAVTHYFINSQQMKSAIFQPIWSHLAMLFMLVFGWDGTGFRRFLYAGTGEDWHNGVNYPLSDFFHSSVFYALLGMSIVFVPTYFGLIIYFRKLTSRFHN